ncbi:MULTISPECIES: SDR family oxidoreductase [unclassified Lysobacter]|uniref:SDR family oxidoreductase n=1 Tax=unclassified Lysobacter TaxID=2635362 RepID=UPI001C2369B3|nr:SDR family oxidoreductase [Lysobacter sp. MMG2]MBU8977326.1 SDR family oxidoreductase [Lysobacter sp. MMG2]
MSPTQRTPRRSLVTGANRGLGLEFVRQLLAAGDHVVATSRHPGKANALNQLVGEHPGRLHVLPLDVAEPKTHAELARELPLVIDGIDLLVNNAGVLHSGERFGHVPPAQLDDSFRTNASGPFLLTQALAERLADGAKVANLSSVLGSIEAVEGFYTPSYAMSKAAQNMGTALLASALRERSITVVALHPGWVQTDMGGSGAQIPATESVRGLLKVIDGLKSADSGRFIDYRGKPVAW